MRVLAWAGAPLPLFRPRARDVRAMREQLVAEHAGSSARSTRSERPMHCHHEKTIVIDDRVAFVGGIDLTSEAGDRFDASASSRARRPSAGTTSARRIEGPAVADVAEHFRDALARGHRRAARRRSRRRQPPASVELQIVRTVPERIYDAIPHGDFGILESYVRALRGAERFIYLENQFLWSPEIAAVLRDKLADPPYADFRLLLVLPAKPNTGGDDTRGVLGELIEADDDAGRVLACTLFARSGAAADPIYVHAKIGIVDDDWLTIGSANLNEHSLFNDTEMNVVTHDPALARADPPAPLGRAPRAADRRDPARPGRGDRRAVEADQQGAARTAQRGAAAHASARPPAARLEALGAGTRPAVGPARRRVTGPWAQPAALETWVSAFLVGRQLGRGEHLEPTVRDRLPTLDREAVRPGGQPRLGALDGLELAPQIVREGLVQLVLVEVGREVRRVVLVGGLAVVLARDPGQRVLDALALGAEKLACAVGLHQRTVTFSRSCVDGTK